MCDECRIKSKEKYNEKLDDLEEQMEHNINSELILDLIEQIEEYEDKHWSTDIFNTDIKPKIIEEDDEM
jgi:hypothetical protein